MKERTNRRENLPDDSELKRLKAGVKPTYRTDKIRSILTGDIGDGIRDMQGR